MQKVLRGKEVAHLVKSQEVEVEVEVIVEAIVEAVVTVVTAMVEDIHQVLQCGNNVLERSMVHQ